MERIEKYIRERVEYLTSPVNYQYGFVMLEEAEACLGELAGMAYALGYWELSESVKSARMSMRRKINEVRKRKIFSDVD